MLSQTKQRILCVIYEGNMFFNQNLEEALKKKNYHVVVRNYQNLQGVGSVFNLVIQLGLSAREDEGIEVLRDLRRQFSAPCVVVSGHQSPVVAAKVRGPGFHYFERDPRTHDTAGLLALIDELACVT